MTAYIIRRLLLIVPTLFGIMVLNFVIIQAAPTPWISPPKLETRFADQTARKTGCWNGARAPPRSVPLSSSSIEGLLSSGIAFPVNQ